MASRRPLVAVIGGGISGVAAAHEIARDGRARVVLLEALPRLGGTIRKARIAGTVVEQGADAVVESPAILELIESLGLSQDVVRPKVFGGLIATSEGLRAMPTATLLGVPLRPWAAVRSRSISPIDGLRCWSEHLWPTRLTGPDVALGPFVSQRFGRGILDKLVDPLLAGSRAGDPSQMSLAAAAPQLDAAARASRSSLRGLKKMQHQRVSFLSLRNGLESLIEAMAPAGGKVQTRTGTRVGGIRPQRTRFEIEGADIVADGVVVTAPAYVAARLLSRWPRASGVLASIPYASFVVTTLVYAGHDDALPGPGSGILVPSGEARLLSACTFYSRKWGTSPPDRTIVRAVAGRKGSPSWMKAPGRAIAQALDGDFKELTATKLELSAWKVRKLPRSLPQYEVGHRDKMANLDEALPPRVAIAGAAVGGTGIPDCIESGRQAARSVVKDVLG